MRCDIGSLNIHVPSEVSTEPDLSFDGSSTFEATVRDRSIDKYSTFHFCG